MADQSGINERQRELFIRKSTRVAAAYLKRAKELAELPDAAKPFFDVLENTYVKLADIQKPEDTKSIGTLCVMVPAELVYAAGAMPVRLCSGSYTAYSIGDDYIPRDACPLVKAVMGFGKIKALPAFDNCSLLVAPVTCDCKKKLAGTIDSVKDTIPLHIPPLKKDDADTEIFLKELYRLIPLLENVTGKQVTAKSLAEGINMVGNAQYEMSEFLKYRRHDLSLMSGTQVMSVKCAAGTGKFMEVIAQILETTIDQVGPLSLESTAPCDINSTCVVFAQSEVISLVARKVDRRDILAGMHLSMAKRIIKMMKKSEKGGDILMTGGGALNTGIHRAFEEEMLKDVYVAKYPQFNGAVGAALIASERGGI